MAAVQAVAWSIAVPPLQGPDESAHFAYTQYLAETGHAPGLNSGSGPYSSELVTAINWAGLNPLRGNLNARPAWTGAEQREWRRVDDELPPGSRSNGGGPNSTAVNPPLYYAYTALPYLAASGGSIFDRLLAVRWFTALLYLATVALAWLVAGELLGPVRWLQALAAASVALLPQLSFIGSMIGPDVMLTAVWSGFILAALRLVRLGPSRARLLGVAVLCAASGLTHPRGIVILVPAVAAVVLACRRHGPWLSRRAVWIAGGAACAIALVGAYVVLTSRLSTGVYGGSTNVVTTGHFNARQFLSYLWQFYFPKLSFMTPMVGPPYGWKTAWIQGFYGNFGSLEVLFPRWVYSDLRWASELGLFALALALVVRRAAVRRRLDALVLLVVTAVTLLLALHLAAYKNLLVNPSDPILVGRYLFPVVTLFGVAIACVASALPRRLGWAFAGVVVAAGVLLQLAGLGLTWTRFYA